MPPVRLRPAHDADTLAALYARPHDHMIYGRGHGERVNAMVRLGRDVATRDGNVRRIADLSCGNAYVATTLARELGAPTVVLGDVAPGYPFYGPLERTIDQLPHSVDLFICGETLEHLDDPAAALAAVRARTRLLVMSTPTENWEDTNAEHYWAWSEDDVSTMLIAAGFTLDMIDVVDSREYGEPYRYGIWTCT